MIKSPLRYPGGKSRAIPQIMPFIPDYEEYREPFLGGGSIFIHLKQLFPDKKYWVNDLYLELYRFWQQSQLNIDEVVLQICKWRATFSDGKELFKFLKNNIPTFNEIETAAGFFIFNRITFSGTTESGGFSEQAFKGRFTTSSVERLEPFSLLLENTVITNFDYEILLKEDGKNVFIFLDPPYYSATQSALYGKNGKLHKVFDHNRFAENLKQCKHQWLVTYDDSEYIRNLFSFAHIKPWSLKYGMRNVSATSTQIGKELLIANYPLEELKSQQLILNF